MARTFAFALCCLLGLTTVAAPAAANGAGDLRDQLHREQKHFLECLGYVYSPALWFSYGGALYFTTFTEAQAQQLEQMRKARSEYVALTDRQRRHELTANGVKASGVDESWQKKLLLPYSPLNESLTPTLSKRVLMLPSYKLLQRLDGGDVLLQDDAGTVYFVMNHGRALDDGACTNGLLVKEGEKAYTTQSGGQNRVEAFASVGLNAGEKLILERVSAEFRREAAALRKPTPVKAQDRDEFEILKSRATDSSPYMQYLVAKAHLEGKGTQRDEKLGLEWMRRAESNGSGDARSYFESHPQSK